MKDSSKPLKNVEYKIAAELMRNSRRSDREIAKIVGVSQPTVSRIMERLEKNGVIREYTMIPDFGKLGYQLMGITFFKLGGTGEEAEKALRKRGDELDRQKDFASLMVVEGLGVTRDRAFVTLYKDYSEYLETVRSVKQLPGINVESMVTFLVDLQDKNNYRILTMSKVACHLSSLERA